MCSPISARRFPSGARVCFSRLPSMISRPAEQAATGRRFHGTDESRWGGRGAGIRGARNRARGRRGGSGNAAEAHATWGDGGGIQLRAGALGGETVPASARRAPARRFGEGSRKARTSARASAGHNRAREHSPPPHPRLAPNAFANETCTEFYVAGCPYPVESAHPSRKEAP